MDVDKEMEMDKEKEMDKVKEMELDKDKDVEMDKLNKDKDIEMDKYKDIENNTDQGINKIMEKDLEKELMEEEVEQARTEATDHDQEVEKQTTSLAKMFSFGFSNLSDDKPKDAVDESGIMDKVMDLVMDGEPTISEIKKEDEKQTSALSKMFSFGFSTDSSMDEKMKDAVVEPAIVEKLDWAPAKEIYCPLPDAKYIETLKFNEAHYGGSPMKILTLEEAKKLIPETQNIITEAEQKKTDLIPAKYEGGLKVWECTEDLAYYLQDSEITRMTDKLVLDLGCGAGVLGIYALMNGATVHFQDYNEEVLTYYTATNVALNSPGKNLCRYFSGDWESFANLGGLKYDYILTSETIYNPSCHERLLEVFKKKLKTTGILFIASKTYYFGVGGGLRQLEKLMQDDGTFKIKLCWRCQSGVLREIWKVTFK